MLFFSSRQPDFKPCTCFLEDDSKCPALQVDNRCRIRLTGDLLYEASYDGYLHLKVNSTNHVGSATSEDTKLFYTDFSKSKQEISFIWSLPAFARH